MPSHRAPLHRLPHCANTYLLNMPCPHLPVPYLTCHRIWDLLPWVDFLPIHTYLLLPATCPPLHHYCLILIHIPLPDCHILYSLHIHLLVHVAFLHDNTLPLQREVAPHDLPATHIAHSSLPSSLCLHRPALPFTYISCRLFLLYTCFTMPLPYCLYLLVSGSCCSRTLLVPAYLLTRCSLVSRRATFPASRTRTHCSLSACHTGHDLCATAGPRSSYLLLQHTHYLVFCLSRISLPATAAERTRFGLSHLTAICPALLRYRHCAMDSALRRAIRQPYTVPQLPQILWLPHRSYRYLATFLPTTRSVLRIPLPAGYNVACLCAPLQRTSPYFQPGSATFLLALPIPRGSACNFSRRWRVSTSWVLILSSASPTCVHILVAAGEGREEERRGERVLDCLLIVLHCSARRTAPPPVLKRNI